MVVMYRPNRTIFEEDIKQKKEYDSIALLIEELGPVIIEYYCFDARLQAETFSIRGKKGALGLLWFETRFEGKT